MPDVLFALIGDVRRNSRALRQLRALTDLGCSIEVLTLGPQEEQIVFEPGIQLRVLKRPSGSGPLFFLRVHRLIKQAARSISAEVYHASDLYTLPAMDAAARKRGGRLVFDSRELYPYVASTVGRPWVRWFWKTVERRYIPRADAVFTVNESIARQLAGAYKVTPPVVLPNVPPFEHVEPSSYLHDVTGIPNDVLIILHQGSIQKDRGCRRLAAAMEYIDNAALVFLGDGPLKKSIEEEITSKKLEDQVYFVPPVPPDELLPVTASADIGVTLLADTCRNHRFALPNKLFEYLMAGLPVLASDLPEIGGIVRRFDVGRMVDPSDQNALIQTLQEMIDHPERRRAWTGNTSDVFEVYNWEKAAQAFKEEYEKLLFYGKEHRA